jgi:hypothetical protein
MPPGLLISVGSRDSIGEEVREWTVRAFAQPGVDQRLARKHLVAHGRVMHKEGLNCCYLSFRSQVRRTIASIAHPNTRLQRHSFVVRTLLR